MLKHLKLKAALLQQDISSEVYGTSSQSDQASKLQISINNDQEAGEGSLECNGSDDNVESDKVQNAVTRENRDQCHKPIQQLNITPHSPEISPNMRLQAYGSDIACNAYRLPTCHDPSCNCSAGKHHSPNMDEQCHCLSCQQHISLPHLAHRNESLSCLHSQSPPIDSPYLHHPPAGTFISPEHNYHPTKNFYQPPFNNNGMEWNRYPEPVFKSANLQDFSNFPQYAMQTGHHHHRMYSHKTSSGYLHLGPLHYGSSARNHGFGLTGQKLSLPLSRSMIVSLLKDGRCEDLLQLIDGPLHDELGPLYPQALQTVLEILDVVEKDFFPAYQSDLKVESDIYQLTNFVKNMKKSAFKVRETSNENREVSATAEKVDFASQCSDEAAESECLNVEVKECVSTGTDFVDKQTNNTKSELHGAPSANGVKMGVNNIQVDAKLESTPNEEEDLTENIVREITDKIADYKSAVAIHMYDGEKESKGTGKEVGKIASVKSLKESGGSINIDVNNGLVGEQHRNENNIVKKSLQVGFHKIDHSKVETMSGKISLGDQKLAKPYQAGASDGDELLGDERVVDVVDALLDQTLFQSGAVGGCKTKDDSPSKNQSKDVSSKVESAGRCESYRDKGFKMRSLETTKVDIVKNKTAVKLFGYVGKNKEFLCNSKSIDSPGREVKDMAVPVSNSSDFPKDENVLDRFKGNVHEGITTDSKVGQSISINIDDIKKKGDRYQEGHFPRDPTSPTSTESSVDYIDFKTILEKSNEDKSTLVVGNDTTYVCSPHKILNSSSLLLSRQKESFRLGASGKPLIAKSFHGKVLLLKHSTEPPHPIPLEVIDSDFVHRDPRIALSNLMEHKPIDYLQVLEWKSQDECEQMITICGPDNNSATPSDSDQNVLNIRDPRIRRRISGDKCLTDGPANDLASTSRITDMTGNSESGALKNTSIQPSEQSSSKGDDSNTSIETYTTEVKSNNENIQKRIQKVSKTNPDKSVVILSGDNLQGNDLSNLLLIRKQSLKLVIHSTKEAGEDIHSIREEVEQLVSGPSFSEGSITDVDKKETILSFKEALAVLKVIKSGIKKDLGKVDMKVDELNKDILKFYLDKLKLLRQASEIGLLAIEVQIKRASGKKVKTLTGILEDHFILTADLTVLILWLTPFRSGKNSVKGMFDLENGVFSRSSAPCMKKICKWLKNRYKLDGFKDPKLFDLVSMTKKTRSEKRSRSRSSSTGHEKKRKIESEVEKQNDVSIESIGQKDKSSEVTKSTVKVLSNEQREESSSPQNVEVFPSPNETLIMTSSDVALRKIKLGDATNEKKRGEELTEKIPPKKQSVSVNSGIEDLHNEMEDVKGKVFQALRKRNTSVANCCLKDLPVISQKVHLQLEDEKKAYTSLKNVSPDTKAKFKDVIMGIQRLILDCEILVYSLSTTGSRGYSRDSKDALWEIAQRSSNKPSYEEELCLLLSLRRSYLNTELWRYIKFDVDERINDLQKKCRSRGSTGSKGGLNARDSKPSDLNTTLSRWYENHSPEPNCNSFYDSREGMNFSLPVNSFLDQRTDDPRMQADHSSIHGLQYATLPLRTDMRQSPMQVFDNCNNYSLPPDRRLDRDYVDEPFDIYTASGRAITRENYLQSASSSIRNGYPNVAYLPRDDHLMHDARRSYDEGIGTWNYRRTSVDEVPVVYDNLNGYSHPCV